jgi:hypothetical protein
MEAALQNYLLSDKKAEKDRWIQALLFSSEYVVVHPQFRMLQNLPKSLHLREELGKIEQIEVADLNLGSDRDVTINDELLNYEIVIREYEKYYGINFKNPTRNVLEKVTSVRLQN